MARDPLWRDVPLDRAITLRVLGVPVRFESNSADVIALACETFGADAGDDGESDAPARPLSVRILVEPGERTLTGHVRMHWRMPHADLLLVRGEGVAASVDLACGRAAACVEEPVARDREHFRYSLLSGAVLVMLGRRDRHAVHAAAVRAGDAALLLSGSSGVGKSTLAYVADREGMSVLAEDAVYVQRDPELRVWGLPSRVHLLDDARERWSELASHATVRPSAIGERKLAVPLGASAESGYVRRARVCLVRRDGGPLALREASPDEIRDALFNAPEAASDLNPRARAEVADALAAPGGWCLNLSSDPYEALPVIQEMLSITAAQR